jgi:hypothetical protein
VLQLVVSIVVMFAVVGTLVGWAVRTDRQRRADSPQEGR